MGLVAPDRESATVYEEQNVVSEVGSRSKPLIKADRAFWWRLRADLFNDDDAETTSKSLENEELMET